ncbi:MAG: DNA primase, partial [Leeuwenhoekiella sp.]|nr:DNA primase [Leeuwenhoekiella sp.]
VLELDVYEKIYLDLQEDETEFANEQFRNLYVKLIEALTQQRENFKIETFINTVNPDEGSLISDIILNEDKYVLHRWDTQEIYVKLKKETVAQVVSQTVLYLRRFYVSQKIEQLAEVVKTPENSSMEVLMDIKDYQELNKFIALKLNRVV